VQGTRIGDSISDLNGICLNSDENRKKIRFEADVMSGLLKKDEYWGIDFWKLRY